MKKNDIKILVFNIMPIIILLLNNLILKKLNYIHLVVILAIVLIIFRYVFGFDKDNHRFSKDIVFNFLIILLSFFFIYYLLGIVIGFVKTANYLNVYGLTNFIVPYILVIILKEFLRYQILSKDNNKVVIVCSCLLFIIFDIIVNISMNRIVSYHDAILFILINVFPIISKNIACSYISLKVGYKPNLLWVLVMDLYGSILPIVPNLGVYLTTMLNFLLPIFLIYNVYTFFDNRKRKVPSRHNRKIDLVMVPVLLLFIAMIIYFTSGKFKYYAIAIATGSMTPNINVGDVVIINQKYDLKKLKVGQVIAYKYKDRIIVHRLVEIEDAGDETYYYTKGDANNAKDDYIIYEDTILGMVNKKVPYIGLPTVWLSELQR